MAKTYHIKPKRGQKPLKKGAKKPFPKKKALTLLLMTALFFTVYQFAIAFYWGLIVDIYCTAAGLLLLAYIFIKRGVFTIPNKKNLPKDWDDKKKDDFLAELHKRKKCSEPLLYFIIPLIFTVVIDMFFIFLEINLGIGVPSL